jgi:hypothetical protein
VNWILRRKNPYLSRGFSADTGRFELPVEFNPDTSLAVKPIRPLWHVSILLFPAPLDYPKLARHTKRRIYGEEKPRKYADYYGLLSLSEVAFGT